MSGALIAFEGVDGAGKTTQLAAFVARLRALGLPVRTCAEPGGTSVGNDIRALLLRPGASIAPRAEALL
ncbi:MAG: dTMP kinase, partial [Gemmatimonadaceae bacterium]